jgi:excisionase family DNA binding protein
MTAREAARRLEVHPNTIYNYLKKGRIKASQHPLTGRWDIPVEELQRLLKEGRNDRKARHR